MISVAAVSYFNARPLVECLRDQEDLDVVDLPPAEAAQALLDGKADVGLVPCVTLLAQDDLTYLPGLCIGADGPVDSVLLYLHRFFDMCEQDVFKIALDPHSRTSQMLARIFLKETMGLEKHELSFEEVSPKELMNAPAESHDYDGFLVIGDLALNSRPSDEWLCFDLAEAWKKMTGLPFVFAVWGLRQATLDQHPELVNRFRAALDAGMEQIDTIVSEMAPGFGLEAARGKHYLTERIVFHLDERAERGLNEFLDRCRAWKD